MKQILQIFTRYQSFLGVILIFAMGIILCQIDRPYIPGEDAQYNPFLTSENQTNVLRQVSINGILAVGMTLVILTAGIDLSVGAVLAVCGIMSADILAYYGTSVWLVVLLTLLMGAVCGFGNGLLVTKCRLQPFIATLAMMSIARGMARFWGFWHGGGGQLVGLNAMENTSNGPVYYENIRQFFYVAAPIPHCAGLKVPTIIFLVVVVLGIVILRKTQFGRYIYAIGGNEEAARLSGINVNMIKIYVYSIAGLLAGLAGLVYSADFQSGDPNAGIGYELDAIAAVVIGGTSLMGGIGTMTGTLLGALIIGYINNIMVLKGLNADLQLILKGVIIVMAVMLQRTKNS
jgi:ribose transport system permease protein